MTGALSGAQNPAYRGSAFFIVFVMANRFLKNIYHKLSLTIRFFTAKRVMAQASALTYSTLLAFVPVVAVIFAIARGFGYNKYIEIWFRDALSSQPQAAEAIIGFVNSYLIHTKSGIFLGIGLIFMFYTVLMLMNNVEETFNHVWQVSNSRPIIRSFTNYLAVFLLFPIILIIAIGLSFYLTAFATEMSHFEYLGPVVRYLLDLIPYILMSLLFIGLYIYMPNTRVKPSCAIIPGILAGVGMQILQIVYIHSQIWVTGYNAIYGSFAALPLFMLWIQMSWTICLFGAQLTYTNQNMNRVGIHVEVMDIHPLVDMTDDELSDEAARLYSDRLDSL